MADQIFDDMLTTHDFTGRVPSDKATNKNHENSKERNAPKNYGKKKTTTVLSDKCKKKKK